MSGYEGNPMVRWLPDPVKRLLRSGAARAHVLKTRLRLSCLRFRMFADPPHTSGKEHFLGYEMHINDGPNFYMLYKDIFVKRIYHFQAQRPDPLILDCGSNIGMSILYFKRVYPHSRIIGFEPDPVIFPYLEENVARNHLEGVQLHRAAITAREGTLRFYSDGMYGSSLSGAALPCGSRQFEVPCMRLRDFLAGPVDFLKMNIEGAEWEVLADSEGCLRQIREMVIEYHHLPGLPRSLHDILGLLHRQGFEYLINDLDPESNSGVLPPFRLMPESRYFLLIYAKRAD